MEPVSRLLGSFTSAGGPLECQGLVCAAWPAAVGKRIAARTHAAKMVRTRLVIEVEDEIWKRQLFSLSGQILRNLAKRLGPGIVDDLEFRVVPPRREPQRAASAQVALTDDAAQIADPVLRCIYIDARKKASA